MNDESAAKLLLLLQTASTLAMVGLIWFVQIVHYPLFAKVGVAGFAEYELSHQRRTTVVVAPLMLVEAVTSVVLLWIRPPGVSLAIAITGAALVAMLWASTFLWQVPAHERLARMFEREAHLGLVRSNWLRTAGWTARGILVCWMCLQLMR